MYIYRRVVFPRKSIPSSYTFVKPISRPTHSSPPPTMTRVYLRIPSPFLPSRSPLLTRRAVDSSVARNQSRD